MCLRCNVVHFLETYKCLDQTNISIVEIISMASKRSLGPKFKCCERHPLAVAHNAQILGNLVVTYMKKMHLHNVKLGAHYCLSLGMLLGASALGI